MPPSTSTNSESANGDHRPQFSELERLTCITGISRAQIGATLSQMHGPWLLHIGIRERIALLEVVATMFGAVGHLRKEAYILREVLGCVMDLLVCGREETNGRTTSAVSGLRERSPSDPPSAQGTVGVRANESSEGNESVLLVIKHVCKVHGIDLEAVKLVNSEDKTTDGNASSADSMLMALEDDQASQEPFGWPELQIGIVREMIAAAESLPGKLQHSILVN